MAWLITVFAWLAILVDVSALRCAPSDLRNGRLRTVSQVARCRPFRRRRGTKNPRRGVVAIGIRISCAKLRSVGRGSDLDIFQLPIIATVRHENLYPSELVMTLLKDRLFCSRSHMPVGSLDTSADRTISFFVNVRRERSKEQ
jgi:hypothetical protein